MMILTCILIVYMFTYSWSKDHLRHKWLICKLKRYIVIFYHKLCNQICYMSLDLAIWMIEYTNLSCRVIFIVQNILMYVGTSTCFDFHFIFPIVHCFYHIEFYTLLISIHSHEQVITYHIAYASWLIWSHMSIISFYVNSCHTLSTFNVMLSKLSYVWLW